MDKKTLILNSAEVEHLINMGEALQAVRDAFFLHGKNLVTMPTKIYLHLDKYGGDFRAMPAYIASREACGIKWVNVHPKNRRFGFASVMALIILSDPATGFPLCIMDGTLITNLRTGAAGGLAARYLAKKDSRTIGLVGCGAQAKTQLLALRELFKIKSVYVWGNKLIYAKKFLKDLKYLGLDMEIKEDISGCVKEADIVVTATPSRIPIVQAGWIKEGTHINAIGADAKGKEELAPQLVRKAKIVVDDVCQACHSGEINVPISRKLFRKENIYATLGEIVAGKKRGRESEKEITIFDSTGLAIQDIAVANLVYKKALKAKSGKWIKLL